MQIKLSQHQLALETKYEYEKCCKFHEESNGANYLLQKRTHQTKNTVHLEIPNTIVRTSAPLQISAFQNKNRTRIYNISPDSIRHPAKKNRKLRKVMFQD